MRKKPMVQYNPKALLISVGFLVAILAALFFLMRSQDPGVQPFGPETAAADPDAPQPAASSTVNDSLARAAAEQKALVESLRKRALGEEGGDTPEPAAGGTFDTPPAGSQEEAGELMAAGQRAFDDGKFIEAAAAFQKGVELYPRLGEFHLALASCYEQMEQWQQAYFVMKKYSRLNHDTVSGPAVNP